MEFYGFKDTDLITELAEWKKVNDENFSIENWIDFQLSPELLIGYSTILFPKFIEFKGGVFLNEPDLSKWSLDFIAKQKLYNHQHIIDLFTSSDSYARVTISQLKCIGKILQECWSLKLRSQFPHLKTHCELTGLDGDGDDFWILF